jgi:hypothetical protein
MAIAEAIPAMPAKIKIFFMLFGLKVLLVQLAYQQKTSAHAILLIA